MPIADQDISFTDADADVLETCFRHQLDDLLPRPIMRDPRQHLVEHDRPQMGEVEACQQFEIFVRPQSDPQGQPQYRCRVEREMMDEGDRQTAEQRPAQRVQECHEPAVALRP